MSVPKEIPAHLIPGFSMNDRIPIRNRWFDDSRTNNLFYSVEEIEKLIAKAKARETYYYGITDAWLYTSLERYPITGKSVAIFGSMKPWYEAVCLVHQGIPTTIDYGSIKTGDPRLITIKISRHSDLQGTQFDTGLSISSFEHDGLGRYGDPLDPDGDLKAMAWAKSLLREGGLLLLSIPVGRDALIWNAHRVYGRLRLPLLLAGWDIVDSFGYEDHKLDVDIGIWCPYQPVLVLRGT